MGTQSAKTLTAIPSATLLSVCQLNPLAAPASHPLAHPVRPPLACLRSPSASFVSEATHPTCIPMSGCPVIAIQALETPVAARHPLGHAHLRLIVGNPPGGGFPTIKEELG